jgi:phosphatidylserine/phosphatidylglycerophosphate/cardiolipin synthase-like enzyme
MSNAIQHDGQRQVIWAQALQRALKWPLLILLGSAGVLSAAGPAVGEFDSRSAVMVTRDAAETTHWKLELLRHAQHSIELSANFAGGPEYREGLRLMAEAMERNPQLKVHLLYETVLMDPEDRALTEGLKERFPDQFHAVKNAIELEITQLGSTVGNHLKILTVDEKYFVIGGTNFEQTLSTQGLKPEVLKPRDNSIGSLGYAGARDMDVVGVGPLAETLRRAYFVAHARLEQLVLTGELNRDDQDLEQRFSRYYPVPNGVKTSQVDAGWTSSAQWE